MEQKRFVLALALSMAILMGWQMFVVPKFFPPPPPAARQPVARQRDDAKKAAKQDAEAKPAEKQADAQNVARKADDAQPPTAKPKDKADAQPKAEKEDRGLANGELPKFPRQIVKLGSIEAESGYRLYVTLTSRGAAVGQIELNDPRYRDLGKGHPPLKIVGPGADGSLSLQTVVPQFGADLAQCDWEVVSQNQSEATFRMPSPDGSVEVLKHYSVKKRDPPRQHDSASEYELHLDLTFKNKGQAPRILNYELLGPVGVPLENLENTQKFRDVVVSFTSDNKAHWITGKALAEDEAAKEEWKGPLRWIGVDVQYFAALLIPGVDQSEKPYTKSSTQKLVGPKEAEKSDVSVQLTSVDLALAGAGDKAGHSSLTHSYDLFAGPKRDDLLAEIDATKVIDYGMFAFISQTLLAVLNACYKVFHSYGIAIICLTVLVRSCMFPLSIKQARSAAKMQELQPEIAAIKEKYAKDKEKLTRAQMELFSKHNYNPLGGCLPVLVQLPVFMGLYQSLSHAVELRMAKFLWIDNLAAPDALFDLPFRLPFLGWNQFNLLPMITIVLFIVQQKMFMPPPTNEEEALRNKMMNYMMIFMGFMFYKVPAGLCVYFIASSLWGLAERKLLPKSQKKTEATVPATVATSSPSRSDTRDQEPEPAGEGFLARLLKAADKELAARNAPQRRDSAPGKRK